MTQSKIKSSITLFANIGVIGGLIFLGYEVQQNTTQLRAESSYSINQALSMLNSGIYNDPVLAEILDRGEKTISSLNSTELCQFIAFQFDRINLGIHVLALEKEGLSEIHFPYVEFLIKEFHKQPGLQEFLVLIQDDWAGSRELYDRLRIKGE